MHMPLMFSLQTIADSVRKTEANRTRAVHNAVIDVLNVLRVHSEIHLDCFVSGHDERVGLFNLHQLLIRRGDSHRFGEEVPPQPLVAIGGGLQQKQIYESVSC